MFFRADGKLEADRAYLEHEQYARFSRTEFSPIMDALFANAEAWLRVVIVYAGAVVIGLLLHFILFTVVGKLTKRIPAFTLVREAVLRRSRGPLRLLIPLLIVTAVEPLVWPLLSSSAQALIENGLHILIVIGVAWLMGAAVLVIEDVIGKRYSLDEADNLQARKIITQVRILRRIAVVVIGVLALGAILLQYEPFRELGTGILASAGIVGIVVGIAAQRTLGNLIAGFQIAFTQPIRVDDVVIAEGDFGWVEEITLTYVVVRVWDQRRIVVPITKFVEEPFQNWTRTTSELLGTVFLYVDHTIPFSEVRAALGRIVEASAYYDGRVWRLHVTNTSEKTVELRALMSASSAPDLWELRCEVREKLIAYVQEHYPEALPKTRAQLQEPHVVEMDEQRHEGVEGRGNGGTGESA